MVNYLLVFIASLFLVPWGLCLPRDHGGLEIRQATPPTEPCPAGAISPDKPVWLEHTDTLISIEVHVEVDDFKGYFGLVVDAETGDVQPSYSHLVSAQADISPYYDAGAFVAHEGANTTDYHIWIDSQNQTTPNFIQGTKDQTFAGVWPRLDMQVNRTTHPNFLTMSWSNAAQGAYSVNLPDYGMYHCGPV